jgi:putative MATE family efflux protein
LYNYESAIFRSQGDTRTPLFCLIVAGGLNIGLNIFFIRVFHMTADGVALATVISNGVSALLLFLFLLRSETATRIRFSEFRIDRSLLRQMMAIGLPAGLQGMMFSLSNMTIQSSINSFGEIAMAGNTAGGNLDGFIYIALNSLYHAALTFTGQNVGAKKWKRLNRVLLHCSVIVLSIGLVMGFGIYFLGEQLLAIYAPDEPDVIMWGMIRLKYLATTYFLCGLMEVACGMLRGIGQSFVSMVISLTGTCAMRVLWIYTVFAFSHTMETLYLSYPVTWLITFTVDIICYVILKNRLIRHVNELEAASASAAVQ